MIRTDRRAARRSEATARAQALHRAMREVDSRAIRNEILSLLGH